MKNILRIIGIAISCLYLTFNSYGQSSGLAITLLSPVNGQGSGTLATATDNVAGKIANPVNTTLQFYLNNVYAITANENPLLFDVFGDSVYLDSTMTGLNYLNWDNEVKVYPNPANNYFVIASSLTNISKISILNQVGEIVYKNEKPRMPQRINVSNINNGIYILRIETKEGVMHRKIQVNKIITKKSQQLIFIHFI